MQFIDTLMRFRFVNNLNGHSMFTLKRGADFIISVVYVDDVYIDWNICGY